MSVKPKKHLGQHFLKDETVCQRMADAISHHQGYSKALEIGPGMGVLTKFLMSDSRFDTWVIEIDGESVAYLEDNFQKLKGKILPADFLKIDLQSHFPEPIGIFGNFPYNISSQILFRVYDHRNHVPEVVGMFQKEVAERVAAQPGNKTYGILSVLLQAFYDIEYLFTVERDAFIPPPKVQSGIIRLVRNKVESLDCDEKLFKQVVKLGFNQRRKMLRKSLQSILKDKDISPDHNLMTKRPEQLSVDEFVELTLMIQE